MKKVLITGAASGLGRELSGLFDAADAIVLALDINRDGLDDLAAAASDRLETYSCDLLDRSDTARVIGDILNRHPAIDILINNAGVTSGKWLHELSDSDVERTFRINALSHFQLISAVLPAMMAQKSGHIVTVASAGGIVASPRMADYAASKFAAVGIDEALRAEFKHLKSPIRTTLIAPFFINTGMFEGVKTRFSFLLPILEQEKVAKRIFHAIRKGKKRLIMPWFVFASYPLRLLPLSWFDALVSFFGISEVMDDYTGRTHSPDQTAG